MTINKTQTRGNSGGNNRGRGKGRPPYRNYNSQRGEWREPFKDVPQGHPQRGGHQYPIPRGGPQHPIPTPHPAGGKGGEVVEGQKGKRET